MLTRLPTNDRDTWNIHDLVSATTNDIMLWRPFAYEEENILLAKETGDELHQLSTPLGVFTG